MIVNLLFLDYHRKQFTEQVLQQNLNNAGYPFGHIVIDKKGIAAAINYGIAQSQGYDAVVTLANDILMPDNWLKAMVLATMAIPNTGMCGIHCVEGLGDTETINGVTVHRSYTAFGNVLIPMAAIRKVGYFNLNFDPYSMNDAEYALRLNETGHVNYYLHGMKAEHLGHDVGQPSEYRRMKDEGLNSGLEKFNFWSNYHRTNNNYYLDYEQKLERNFWV